VPDGKAWAGGDADVVVAVEVNWGTSTEFCVDKTMVVLAAEPVGVESDGVTIPGRWSTLIRVI